MVVTHTEQATFLSRSGRHAASPTETFHMCCKRAACSFPRFPPLPPLLFRLFSNRGAEENKHFFENIRRYNASLSFASINVTQPVPNLGAHFYKISGQLYCQYSPAEAVANQVGRCKANKGTKTNGSSYCAVEGLEGVGVEVCREPEQRGANQLLRRRHGVGLLTLR